MTTTSRQSSAGWQCSLGLDSISEYTFRETAGCETTDLFRLQPSRGKSVSTTSVVQSPAGERIEDQEFMFFSSSGFAVYNFVDKTLRDLR